MTTRVIITSPKPNHQNLHVEVRSFGTTVNSKELTDGESYETYVYTGQTVTVYEVAKPTAPTP